ncbi:hypothetical protein PVAND_011949 [Polypedilum vanderplanki]|uniref:Uncharacterized protein n=1 Tax=Polypedilum vanderplanki TaxID=319348 RepID=A0A9J6CLX5_POLVA|nr:hypothetical protein PVAND_011949 [Polypedilum vanderplanki]
MNLFSCFIFCYVFILKVKAETIECNYGMGEWTGIDKSFYTCRVENPSIFSSGFRIIIDKETGQHLSEHSFNEVEGIFIYTAPSLNFFPLNINRVFPNLIAISITYSKLSQLTNEDLKPFPKLKFLNLYINEIEFLPENLFNNNPELEVISISHNKIQHIDKEAFSGLKLLRWLDLEDNICESLTKAETREEVLNLVQQIEDGECQSEKYTTINKSPIIAKQKKEIEDLKNQLKVKDQLNQNLLQRNQNKLILNQQMEEEIKELKANVQKCSTFSEKLEQIMEKIMNKLDQHEEYFASINDQIGNFTFLLPKLTEIENVTFNKNE